MRNDVSAERAVLAGICQYGNDTYLDVADILQEETFTLDSNRAIYKCIEHIFEGEEPPIKADIPLIYSAAQSLGIYQFLSKPSETEHLRAILKFPVSEENIRQLAGKIRKLHIAKIIQEQIHEMEHEYTELTGDESIAHILGIAENTVFNLSSLIREDSQNEPEAIGNDIYEYIKHLGENPVQQLGLSTGFPRYDKAIGGGLRPGTVNIISARLKVGKSMLGINMGYNIACKDTPVLFLDTEMTKRDHQHRILARNAECYLDKLETGQYSLIPSVKEKVLKEAKKIQNSVYQYMNISGMPFEEQLAIMRRWFMKKVGINNECIIIYDYIKLMNTKDLSKNLTEYQMLGFMMTSLHNFSIRYKLPILAFVQSNRDGIKIEDTDVVSGSDRIGWLCSNLTIFKKKSPEELAEEKGDHGDRKLVPVVSRHGKEWDSKDYINCKMEGHYARIIEGKSRFEVLDKNENKGFIEEINCEDNKEDLFGLSKT